MKRSSLVVSRPQKDPPSGTWRDVHVVEAANVHVSPRMFWMYAFAGVMLQINRHTRLCPGSGVPRFSTENAPLSTSLPSTWKIPSRR